MLKNLLKGMMIRLTVAIAVLYSVVSAQEYGCPENYRRLSKDHSYCKPINNRCNFVARGLLDGESEIAEILKIHNDYRNKIAVGKETKAGGLPTASNMIELTWDAEMAEVAQHHAEQCHFKHDCNECRAVRSFSAGQNMAYTQYYCNGNCEVNKSNWNGTIAMWYDEVNDYHKSQVSSFQHSAAVIGHFTQVAWASTYKIGCGYVAYKDDSVWIKQFYVCNYGPAGNMYKSPVYKIGTPCSECPENSCCGNACQTKNTYPGLCHLTSSPPIYKPDGKLLFRCAFQEGDPNCELHAGVGEKWELVKTSGGTLLNTVVKEKSSAIVHFQKSFKAKRNSCMILTFRNGPNKAGDKNNSNLVIEFDQNGQKYSSKVWTYPWSDYVKSPVQIFYGGDMKFSIKMSVPAGVPPQYIDIKQIDITEEPCKYGK